MSDVKAGIIGVIEASISYFSSIQSELSDTAKKHITKKSQDQKIELEEHKAHLVLYQEKLRNLEEEKSRIEAEAFKINLRKQQVFSFNTNYKNEIFKLQKQLFELESHISTVLGMTPRKPSLDYEEAENSLFNVKKSYSFKNYQNRIEVSEMELRKAEEQIQKLEEELKNLNKELCGINRHVSSIISEKRAVLLSNKKSIDEKFKNFTGKAVKRSIIL